jgi:uncharacterized protein (TIGR02246 family)
LIAVTHFDRFEIERFVRAWEQAFDRGDYEAMAECYADNAMLVATATPPVVGRPAITEFWRKACEGARRERIQRLVHADQYDSCKDLGYVQGTVSLKRAIGTTTVVWFVTLWTNHVDGTWRIVADTSTVLAAGNQAGALSGGAFHAAKSTLE